MPYKYAKPGTQIYQIRLKLGDQYETHWKEKSSYPFHSSLGQRHRTHLQPGEEAERSTIGCETVKILARTPFGLKDSKHKEISWRIILVNETAQKISLPVERSRNPLRFQGNTMRKQTWKVLRATDCMTLKPPKESSKHGCQWKLSPSCALTALQKKAKRK